MHVSIIIFWLHLFFRSLSLSLSSLVFLRLYLLFLSISLSLLIRRRRRRKKERKKENLPDNIIERSDARASNAHVRDRTPSSILHERRCACCLLLLDEHLPIELDSSSSSSSSLPATKLIFSSKTIRLSKSSLSLDYTSSSIINWTNGENVQTFDSWKKTSISTANIRSTNIFTSFNSD